MNDLRQIEKEISNNLFAFHAVNAEAVQKEIDEFERNIPDRNNKLAMIEEKLEEEQHKKVHLEPFCKIVEVQIGSPAEEAGLKVGDKVLQYGQANYLNHNQLKYIPEITRNHIDKEFPVLVFRDGREVELKVRPHNWKGPGILGCRFIEKLD